MRPTVRQLSWIALVASVGLIATSTLSAQAKKPPANEAALKWGPGPDALPAGAKMAIEKGDPTKSGVFVVRLALPAGYKIPPHWHPTDEHVRVISGDFLVGMGAVFDEAKTMKLAPGDTGTVKANMRHFAVTQVPTEISIRSQGPFAITYVNAADDPRKKH